MTIFEELEQSERAESAAGQSDAIADADRAKETRRASTHTRMVKVLRVLFPLASVCVIALYGMSAFRSADWVNSLTPLAIPDIFPDKLTMDNPHYNGFNDDGSSYNVTAKTAAQDFKRPGTILLSGISGELVDTKKNKTVLTAQSGEYHMRKKRLKLRGEIEIQSSDGMRAKLKSASVVTKTGVISTTEPVFVAMRSSTLRANAMTLWQKEKEVVFTGDVKAHLKQEPPAKPKNGTVPAPQRAAKAASKGMFSSSGAPVDIDSETLKVVNADNRAVFAGNVRARQGDAGMVTRELEVLFEPAAKNGTTGASSKPAKAKSPLGGASGKVKRIIAKYPVVITRGPDQRVTSRRAEFFVAEQRAILEGSVFIEAGQDRQVSSDRVELRQGDETVLFEGDVVVRQAKNNLRGRKLFVDQKRGRMELTSPPGGGAGPGRISATLHREAEAGAKPKKADSGSRSQGSGAVAFKTDPSAPIRVDADSLNVDNLVHAAVFSGRVVAKQGDFQLESAKLSVHYTGEITVADPAATGTASGKSKSEPELKKIVARTNVKVTSQTGQSATGDWAEFDMVANTVELGGDVTLREGKNLVNGTRLRIDMDTGLTVIENATPTANGPSEGWAFSLENQADGSAKKSGSGPPAGFNARGGRPSGVFFPFQLKKKLGKKKKQEPNKENVEGTSSWSATAAPAN